MLPFAVVVAAVAALRPELLAWRGASPALFASAVLAAPIVLGLEYLIHALAAYRTTGSLPRGLALQGFWQGGLTAVGHLLLVAVVVGEEVLYRQLWLGVLHGSFALPVFPALALSSLLYGLNHLAFGPLSVVSKTFAGGVYGGLYLASGGSLWPPILAHGLGNALLFLLARGGDG